MILQDGRTYKKYHNKSKDVFTQIEFIWTLFRFQSGTYKIYLRIYNKSVVSKWITSLDSFSRQKHVCNYICILRIHECHYIRNNTPTIVRDINQIYIVPDIETSRNGMHYQTIFAGFESNTKYI